ncbi:MAG: RNA chaperone Hfq [Armatimonadota bacterium]|nr:RNA chaperone Hfq [Armatimonadota bacterium]
MARAINLQDMFLNQVRKESIPVTVYLSGGVQVNGLVRGFDAFTVLIESPGKPTQLVYKHAMSSIVPSKELPAYKPGGRATKRG